MLESKASSTGTGTGTVNENVKIIVIGDNQLNGQSIGNGNIGLDKADLSLRKKSEPLVKGKSYLKYLVCFILMIYI